MPNLKAIARAVRKSRKMKKGKAQKSTKSTTTASGHQALNKGNIINLDLGKALQKQAPQYIPPIGGNSLAASPSSFMSQLQNLEQMSAARAMQLAALAAPRTAAPVPVGMAGLVAPPPPVAPNTLVAASASAAAAAASIPGHSTPPAVSAGDAQGLEGGDPLAAFGSSGAAAAAAPQEADDGDALGAAAAAPNLSDLAPPLGQGSDINALLIQLDNSILTDIFTIRQLAASFGVPQRSESGRAFNGTILRSKILKLRSLYETGQLDPVFS